jgi:hypothetical protein
MNGKNRHCCQPTGVVVHVNTSIEIIGVRFQMYLYLSFIQAKCLLIFDENLFHHLG